jgi:hypothetical protein
MAKIKEPDHEMLTALYEHGERQTPGTTVRQRRGAAGKKPVRSTDRRYKRGAARSKQYATNVTQEIFDLVDDLLDKHDLTKAEFTERAILYYAAALKAGTVDGGGK